MAQQDKRQPTRKELLDTAILVNGVAWYTYKQLAAKYNVSCQTVFNWVKSGRLEKIAHLGLTLYREVEDDSTR